jgi:hypothetical protein
VIPGCLPLGRDGSRGLAAFSPPSVPDSVRARCAEHDSTRGRDRELMRMIGKVVGYSCTENSRTKVLGMVTLGVEVKQGRIDDRPHFYNGGTRQEFHAA